MASSLGSIPLQPVQPRHRPPSPTSPSPSFLSFLLPPKPTDGHLGAAKASQVCTRCLQVSLALAPLDRWLAAHSEELDNAEGDTGVRADALAMLTGLLDAAARGEDTGMVQQVQYIDFIVLLEVTVN